jgi:6-phosphogluconolactonase
MGVEVVVGERTALVATFTRRVERLAERAVAERGYFAIALPGGSAAETLLPALAMARVDWARVELFWGDERAVPPDDPDSNYGLARSLWLNNPGAPAGRIQRMPADAPDLDEAAREYEARLMARLGTPASLDVALIGVGSDGHVCSLFPGHPLLRESVRLVAAIDDSPKPPPRRLTLTLPALASARLLVVAAFGGSKAAVVREALEEPSSDLPLSLALRRAQRSLLLLDSGAAGRETGSRGARSPATSRRSPG